MKSMYIHVPFCDSICAYCDFERCKKHPTLTRKWLDVIKKDILKRKDEKIDTLYIGGGTPTSLSVCELDELLTICDCFTPIEYTIEANIENLSKEKIDILVKHNINRISLGVQSLQDRLISLIHRHHSSSEIFSKIEEIYESGIENISVDLIYGLPTQTMEEWLSDLDSVSNHPYISHISIYSLTIEENSAFGRMNVEKVEDELDEEMYFQAIELLSKKGFVHYEISNFCRLNKESLHNQSYWNYDDFIGIGCGAYGMENHIYYHIPFKLDQYIQGNLEVDQTVLSVEDECFESIMMGLRMKKGLDVLKWQARFHKDFFDEYQEVLEKNVSLGYLIVDSSCVRCSEEGMGMLNSVLLDFMK